MNIIDIYKERVRRDPSWAKAMREFFSAFHAQAVEHKDKRPVAFAIPFGDRTFTFPLTEERGAAPGVSRMARELLDKAGLTPEPGDLPVAHYWNGFPFPCGVILVTGAGSSGKTPAAYAIADTICAGDEAGFGLLRYGEPFCGYLKTEEVAGLELAQLVARHRAVVVDSIKDLLTDMGGASMESGLARSAVSMLSRLSMTASELGCSIIVPINPSSLKESVAELIREVARSNVAMAVVHDAVANNWKLLARQREGGMRVQGMATLETKDDLPFFKVQAIASESVEATEADINSVFMSITNPEQFPASLARRITKNQPN